MKRGSLIQKCIEKGFDGADIHWFMVKHSLAELWISTGNTQLDSEHWVEVKANLALAHAEIDHTNFK